MADTIGQFIGLWAGSIWAMLSDSALYFLAGLALAGVLSVFLNANTVRRLAGGSPVASVMKAALIGLPLPLCSCSVLPVATQLRKSGFSRGGVMAFLVSTPESGVDSILLTYAMTDPILTVARPVSAYLSAAAVGLTEAAAFEKLQLTLRELPAVAQTPACCDGCGCGTEQTVQHESPISQRILGGIRYAFTYLIADLAPYLLAGFLLAGLVEAVLRQTGMALPSSVTSGWVAYGWAISVGVPIYVCATSSTPLAAVLLGAGFSPGAILVFLLVGPATNLASIAVLRKILGGWPTVRYLVIITAVAVACGLLLDFTYRYLAISASYQRGGHAHEVAGIASLCAAALLGLFILYHSGKSVVLRFAR